MLTIEQCKRLKEAGLKPSDKYQGSFFHRAVGQDIEPYIYHPTVEDMMGWLKRKYVADGGVAVCIYNTPDKKEVYMAWVNEAILVRQCPDVLSALYNLWEKLAAK